MKARMHILTGIAHNKSIRAIARDKHPGGDLIRGVHREISDGKALFTQTSKVGRPSRGQNSLSPTSKDGPSCTVGGAPRGSLVFGWKPRMSPAYRDKQSTGFDTVCWPSTSLPGVHHFLSQMGGLLPHGFVAEFALAAGGEKCPGVSHLMQKYPTNVMVFGGIARDCKSALIVVESGIVNTEGYIDDLVDSSAIILDMNQKHGPEMDIHARWRVLSHRCTFNVIPQ